MAAMSFLTSSQRSLASTMSFAVLYSSNTSQQVPELLLWFFDSRGGNYYQEITPAGGGVPQPNWVDQTVVDWFTTTRTQLCERYGKDVPSLAFVHISVDAMLAFQRAPGAKPHYEPGINDDNPLAQQGYTQGQGWWQRCNWSLIGRKLATARGSKHMRCL